MSRVWFSAELETVATWWRILRKDGVALGFTSHDADLWFDGVMHRATPGMMPSAIRRSADLQPDSAEVEGAISHEAIEAADLAMGRFDGAGVVIGLVDWQSVGSAAGGAGGVERQALYRGTIGAVSEEGGTFTAELISRKAELDRDPVPRTSPACRAAFCGPGCGLSAARFTHRGIVSVHDAGSSLVTVACEVAAAALVGGSLRWLDGDYAGLTAPILGVAGAALVLDMPLDLEVGVGARVLLREGCDRTLATCAGRFGNAINFQAEPFLPGNDLLARYAVGA